MHIADEIVRRGGSASSRDLTDSGLTLRRIEAAIRSGSVLRLRRGWYGAGLDGPRTAAGRAGGAVACISALRHHGGWVMPDDSIHVRVARGTATGARDGLRVHWTNDVVRYAAVDDVATAIACVVRCVRFEEAVVAVDSAINRGLLPVGDVRAICSSTPGGRNIAMALDPASESGIETLARLRLRRRNLRVRSQMSIAGIGRVDLVVGDRLVLELDGRAWHDRPGDFETDRRRDRALVAAGFLVMRASYAQVMGEWSTIEEQILRLVRSRKHLVRS